MVNGLTVKEAARELGVSRSRVYAMIQRGRLGVVRSSELRRSSGGRLIPREMLLDADDVAREREARS